MKNFKSSIVKMAKEHCPFIKNNSKQNNGSEHGKRGFYYDFSPIDVCEDEDKSSYEEEFNQIKYALENEKVKNLAILGKFGTGKSSLISSFFKHAQINNKKLSEKEYVTVSLADFNYLKEISADNIEDELAGNSKSDKDNTSDTTSKNNSYASSENRNCSTNKKNHSSGKSAYQNLEAVEKEIVRQLSFGKLSKNVPISFLSKFKTRLCDTFFISLYLSPLLVIFLSSFFIKDEIVHLFYYAQGGTLTKLLVLTAITSAYVFIFFKFISTRLRFKHLSLSSLSISVEQKDSDNIIDAYLDEITYLFEQSKCKYVIFEDLDRGNNPEVFTHLRNLNIVLNNDIRCKNKNVVFWKRCQRKIVFIYLLRNDLLSPQEMVKFFDFTVSITPYVASSNIAYHALKIRDELYAYYKMIENDETSKDELKPTQEIEVHDPVDQQNKNIKKSSESKISKKSELFTEDTLDNDFIVSVSSFVGDLRKIKQIFNDYQLLIGNFEFLFEDSKNIAKKIFSISALKNYYPSDYNQLLSNNGKLYELMNRKGEYRSFVENVKNYFKDLEDKNDKLSSEDFDQDEWNRSFEILEERYSFYDLVKSKKYKAELCTYLRSKTFLTYLLCNNFISEDYRFYVSKFSKQFSLNRREYSFLRKIYDTNSDYQPKYKLSNAKLELIFSLLPSFTVNSKAVFNISLFNFALKQYNNQENEGCEKFLSKYIEICLDRSSGSLGSEFLLLLCKNLNDELLNKENLSVKDASKLNLLFITILKKCGSVATLTNKFSQLDKNAEFLLFVLVYGTSIFTFDGKLAKWRGIETFVSEIAKSRNLICSIIKKILAIPVPFWNIFFDSLSTLKIVFADLPGTYFLGNKSIEFYTQLDKCLDKNDNYQPFLLNWKNCSTLAKIIYSQKNTDISDKSSERFYLDSVLTIFFDFSDNDNVSFIYIRKAIFNLLFNQDNSSDKVSYINILSACGILERSNFDENNEGRYLNDYSEIVVSLITVLNLLEIHKRLDKENTSTDKDNDLDKQKTVKKEITCFLRQDEYFGLLNKYRSAKYLFNGSTKLLKQCFIDFEYFCIEDVKITFSKVDFLLQSWQDGSFFDLFTIDLNFALAKVDTLSDLLLYSLLPKVNKNTPQHRIKPNIQNIVFVRDYIGSFDLSHFSNDNNEDNKTSFIFNFFKNEIDTAWNSLYEFFKQNFDEISQSSSHLISCPNFGVLDPNRTAKIKDFFLNLDKQD